MQANAEHTHRRGTVDHDRPQPCRFCGETTRLDVVEGYYDEGQFLFDADLKIVRDAAGQPVETPAASVPCRVCDAMAPRLIWNASPEAARTIRAATLAAWPEYDETDGSWRGAVQ